MTGAVRHLARADAIAGDVGLGRARFDAVVRHLTAMRHLMTDDPIGTVEVVARATGATADQVGYVWAAWLSPDSG